jgi:hypothetical protein
MSTHQEAVNDIKKAKSVLDAEPTGSSIKLLTHKNVSMVKSVIRIGAGGCLIQGNLFFAGFLLIFAELLGIAEELV